MRIPVLSLRDVDDATLCRAIRKALTPDLLKGNFSHPGPGAPRMTGHCYVASEAYYYLRGGASRGYRSMHQNHEGVSHWWVRSPSGKIIDITRSQFATPVDYSKGSAMAFMYPRSPAQPSARAITVIERVLDELSIGSHHRSPSTLCG